MHLHQSGEDYLEAILELRQERGMVRSIDVAQKLGFSKPSVSRAMAILRADGYITIPDKPGLGSEINEEACLTHPYQPHTLRHYTGALTDIRPAKTEFYF